MKVLIVEDDLEFGNILKNVMERAGWIVDLAVDGEKGLFFAESGSYEVAILDWHLPTFSGLDLLRMLRQKSIEVPIIMMSARNAVQDKVLSLNLGADDYIVKPFELEEFTARVNALYRRSMPKHAATITVNCLTLDVGMQGARLQDDNLELTGKEFDLLSVLMARRGQLVQRATLMALAYQGKHEPESNSLDVLIARVRKKIAGSGVEIATVRGKGFILRPKSGSGP